MENLLQNALRAIEQHKLIAIPVLFLLFFTISFLFFMSPMIFDNKNSPTGSVVFLKSELGDRWPYPGYTSGIVTCEMYKGRPRAYISLGSSKYSMNGAAMVLNIHPDSRTLMKRDSFSDTYVLGDFHKMLKAGLDLCQ